MKKLFLAVALFVGATVFCSCGDNFLQDMFELVSGNATTTIEGEGTSEYTSSIAMYDEDAPKPFLIGLAMSMDVNDLLSIGSADDLKFPFMAYRLVGRTFSSGDKFSVNNYLTEEDLVDFDYKCLLNGKFAGNHVVGIAVSPTKFYIMSTGTIKLTKVTKNKITGTYSGRAYMIDTEATPMLSAEQVDISGEFKSRVTPMMGWLKNLQDQALAEAK
jgi:hypothetical protein